MKPVRLATNACKGLRPSSSLPARRYASTQPPIVAAAPIQFTNPSWEAAHPREQPFYARMVPASPAYFSAQPNFIDGYLRLRALQGQYAGLPRVKAGEAERVAWRTLPDYRNAIGEDVRRTKYYKIIEILQDLHRIHPSLMPASVKAAIEQYRRDINPFQNISKPAVIDPLGRAMGVGKRKASSARAWLVEGTGEILINGKSLSEHFGRIHDRESALWPLKATDRVGKYNVWALVQGGGTTGQAEAVTLAVAKALMVHEPALKPALRRAGCVTRDPRRVERKKPGHVKARKMPAWVKR